MAAGKFSNGEWSIALHVGSKLSFLCFLTLPVGSYLCLGELPRDGSTVVPTQLALCAAIMINSFSLPLRFDRAE